MNKRDISYQGKKVSIGIDVHRSFFVVSGVCEGELIHRCRIPSSGEAVLSFIGKYFKGAEVKSCYEAGYSGYWLHRFLKGNGINNIVIHAASVEVESRNVKKTDKRDSLKLAQQLDAGRLRGIYVPSERQEAKRLLTRTREQLIRARSRIRIQVRMKLHQFGLIATSLEGVLRQEHVREILKQGVLSELQLSLELFLSQWEGLNKDLKKLDKALLEQSKEDQYEVIYRSVPGFGPIISRVLSNELGDMSQFANERALFSFTGLTPGEYSSGDKVCRGHISRQGNSRLRHVLVEAAWKAIRIDKALGKDFERIAARRGKKRAIVAIARKLIGRARALFKSQGRYEVELKKAA